MAKQPTRDAVSIIHRRFYSGDGKHQAQLEEARTNATIARAIYALRREAGLTQAQLAMVVETSRSVISRLENDDYEGHSLTMLRRIAGALGRRLDIRFVPIGSSNEIC